MAIEGMQVEVATRCVRTRDLFQIVFEEQQPGLWFARYVVDPRDEVDEVEVAADDGLTILRGMWGRLTGPTPAPRPMPTPLTGSFHQGPDYPGCPYCRGSSFWRCGICMQLNCWDRMTSYVTCVWCTTAAPMGSGPLSSLTAGPAHHARLTAGPARLQLAPPAPRQIAAPDAGNRPRRQLPPGRS